MTPAQVTADRIARENRAAARAKLIPPGDYSAYDSDVICNATMQTIVQCESHWDACLVLLAIPKLAKLQ